MLQIESYQAALEIAVEGGDPNNIKKVFVELLKTHVGDTETVINLVGKVPQGLRHLRNFAKNRGETGHSLLTHIYQYQIAHRND